MLASSSENDTGRRDFEELPERLRSERLRNEDVGRVEPSPRPVATLDVELFPPDSEAISSSLVMKPSLSESASVGGRLISLVSALLILPSLSLSYCLIKPSAYRRYLSESELLNDDFEVELLRLEENREELDPSLELERSRELDDGEEPDVEPLSFELDELEKRERLQRSRELVESRSDDDELDELRSEDEEPGDLDELEARSLAA